jgi:hypothetical protein
MFLPNLKLTWRKKMESGCRGATVVDLLHNRGYSKTMTSRITGSDFAGIARDHLYLKLQVSSPVPDEWLMTLQFTVFDDQARHWLKGKVKRVVERQPGNVVVTTEMATLQPPPRGSSPKEKPVILETADGLTKGLPCTAVFR